jgi:hypothetical protein
MWRMVRTAAEISASVRGFSVDYGCHCHSFVHEKNTQRGIAESHNNINNNSDNNPILIY